MRNGPGRSRVGRDLAAAAAAGWRRARRLAGAALALLLAGGCTVGPAYHRPDVATPDTYKENGGGAGPAAPGATNTPSAAAAATADAKAMAAAGVAGNGTEVTGAAGAGAPRAGAGTGRTGGTAAAPGTGAGSAAAGAAGPPAVGAAGTVTAGTPAAGAAGASGGTAAASAEWKVAQPGDATARGAWWESFGDPELNALEEQVNVSNQNIAASFAAFQAARALVREARAQLFPTVTTAPAVTYQRQPAAQAQAQGAVAGKTGTVTEYSLPFDATWTPDLWGRVRNTIRGSVANAQASAADLANERLTEQAELAVDYYQLRGQDTLIELLNSTVVAYKQSLDLTRALYETGIDSDESVAQAETQLEATEAQATNLGIARAQFEHAIALLIGKPPSVFSLAPSPLKTGPPTVPAGVPSALLERRPDVAAGERLVEQANAQIGVAQAAYFPSLTLSGSAGFASTALSTWLTWPSRFWSLGPALAQTLFDGGLRRATVEQFQASYDQAAANYRQTVLTAFQQVEDNLAALHILAVEVRQQDTAVKSAQRQLTLATDRYRLGIDPYLNVITAQTTVLSNQQTAVNLSLQQLTATVQLIEALGGGWDAAQLPSKVQLVAREK
jgi:NodT family efflux transporter outer membrane factor (OMF) lipoprotein